MSDDNKPVAKFRDGAIQVPLWENKTGEKRFYSANVEKSYKDDDDNWQKTSQLTGTDILLSSKLLEQAYLENSRATIHKRH